MDKAPLFSVCLGGLLYLCSAVTASAQTVSGDQPFHFSNRNPFVQIYALPTAESALLTASHRVAVRAIIERGNTSTYSGRDGESIAIDGETTRTAIDIRYGLSEQWEIGVELPYLSHDGGSLDSFIEDWHDTFGLPNGDRDDYPQDLLNYRYQKNGQTLFSLTEKQSGIGDVRIYAARKLSASNDRYYSLRSTIKLPTGDANDLTGSESTDIAAGIYFTQQNWRNNSKLVFHGSAGLLWSGDGEVLESERRNIVAYGSSAISWLIGPKVTLRAQLDLHSPFYQSELRELGLGSAQLTLGAAVRLTQHTVLDLSVNEDIAVETAPDVVFQMALRWQQ